MTDIVMVAESQEEAEINDAVTTLVAKSESYLEITTDPQFEKASELTAQLKAYVKRANEEKLIITKPFRDGVTEINLRFENMVAGAKVMIPRLNQAMVTYADQKARKEREAERKRLEEAFDKAKTTDEAEAVIDALEEQEKAPAAPVTVKGNLGSKTHFRTDYVYELENYDKVEEAYKLPPADRIDWRVVKAKKGQPVAGFSCIERKIPVSRVS